ncbi:MAG: glycosyltransferase family 2 protein [Microbacterium sp.]
MTEMLAVVVVNYGSVTLLERHAARLRMPEGGIIVVVDCFSTGQERAAVARAGEMNGWHVVLLDSNAGFGGGTNAGAAEALRLGADVIVALNPDAYIAPDDLEMLASAARKEPLSLVSPRILDSSGKVWFRGSDLYLDDGSIAGVARRSERAGRPRHEWATGACFAVSAELWNRIGGFDEDYFLYWEDVDLSRRVLDAGAVLRTIDVTAVHDEGQTHRDAKQGRAKSETYYYFNIRNRLLYVSKHGDAELMSRWRRETLRVSWSIILQGGRRQLITSLAPWRALVRGMRDGSRLTRSGDRTLP